MKESWEAAWEQHKDAAAEAAHVRWMLTKQSHGFADHPYKPGGKSDSGERRCLRCYGPEDRHHSDMIPFADLSDEIKAYDYETAIIGFKFGYEAGREAGFADGHESGYEAGSEAGYERCAADRDEARP